MMWQRFTERARKVIFYAQEEAQNFGETQVGPEHLLLALIRETDSVAVRILDRLGVSLQRVRAEIERYAPRGEARPGQEMQLTARAKRVIDLAYDEARQLNHNYIGTEHLLLGLIREREGLAARILGRLGVTLERARQEVVELSQDEVSPRPQKPTAAPSPPTASSVFPLLNSIGSDLTGDARAGKVQAAYERDAEIYTLLQILARMTRHNPLLIGPTGVGKTTLVHGVAAVLAHEPSLPALQGKRVVALTPASLLLCISRSQSATQLLQELHRAVDMVILFIDDLETLFEPADGSSPLDALSLLRLVLQGGKARCIGVYNTGSSERDAERLAQLQPLFEPVPISEPAPEAVLKMLDAHRHRFYVEYAVEVSEEAIQAAVNLSARYIPERHLPGKAFDLLGAAAARLSIHSRLLPPIYYQWLSESELLRTLHQQIMQAVSPEPEVKKVLEEYLQQYQSLLATIKPESASRQPLTLTAHHIAELLHEWTGIPIEQLRSSPPEDVRE
jgi:ATP-dependent Clp protease ATP-binding subunit ClpC